MTQIDISKCTQDAETCPVVATLFEIDEFDALVEPIDPLIGQRRQMIANIVTACVKGTCPGIDQAWNRDIQDRKRREGSS